MTIQEFLVHAAEQLHEVSTLPLLDAEILLSHIMHQPRSFLIAHATDELSVDEERHCNNLVARRAAGVPIAYLVHHKEFYGRNFFVDERVLVPRPETELIIDAVKEELSGKPEGVRILDIGTGSGVLAITLALEVQAVRVIGTDIDNNALAVAEHNADALAAPVTFSAGDVFEALEPDMPTEYDIIVSNPPYVNPETVQEDTPETAALQYEPQHALYSPGSPLATIERIITGAVEHLAPTGSLFIEIGADQGEKALALAVAHFPNHNCTIVKDYSGLDRMLSVRPR